MINKEYHIDKMIKILKCLHVYSTPNGLQTGFLVGYRAKDASWASHDLGKKKNKLGFVIFLKLPPLADFFSPYRPQKSLLQAKTPKIHNWRKIDKASGSSLTLYSDSCDTLRTQKA